MTPLTGRAFARWTVVEDDGSHKALCRCTCGTERRVARGSLISGASKSCGCFSREVAAARRRMSRKHHVDPGDRFERWTVIDATDWSAVRCRCACGTTGLIPASNLYTGASRSCGCLKNELAAERFRANRKHGLGGTPIYACWKHMMARCYRAGSTDYGRYGARGITVHEPWHDVRVFASEVVAEIGPLHPGMTLDRVNNDGPYRPGNIRWATRLAQAQNRHSGYAARRAVRPGDLAAVQKSRRKLSHAQLEQLLSLIESGATQTQAAQVFGISQPHVSRIVRESRNPSR